MAKLDTNAKNKLLAFLTIMAFLLISLPVWSKVPTACIGNNNIVKLEVASTPEEVTRGLMYRTELPEGSGMVFLFIRRSQLSSGCTTRLSH